MPSKKWDVAVIGGGAAGFFAAISVKQSNPEASVILLEKSNKFLAKVKISGGGRCNVTNACTDPKLLATHYPRGEHFLKKAFGKFGSKETMQWFEDHGVTLKTYPDGCVFPFSNDSQTVIDCFLHQTEKHQIQLELKSPVKALHPHGKGFSLELNDEVIQARKVILATGGQPKKSGLDWISALGIKTIDPVPSLFTFNLPENPINALMGVVVEQAEVRLEGTKLRGKGPLLITHWGLSGPAVLQLSAWGAREIAVRNYHFTVYVNWLQAKEIEVNERLLKTQEQYAKKHLKNACPFDIPIRLWQHLLKKAGMADECTWQNCSERLMNKLVQVLVNDRYEVSGKTTYKEEFVTAGGVCLSEVNYRTMECKHIPGLYVTGELLDVDGITGGFNFQAAWTTAYLAGRSAAELER
jgi:predicted Rossmann fold flavoprotein